MNPELRKNKQTNNFYCKICKIWCPSALNLKSHFLGYKHKMVEETLKARGLVKPSRGSGEQVKMPGKLPVYEQSKPQNFQGRTLEKQLNMYKNSEPALGLNYIIEYRSKQNFPFLYECQLCQCRTGLSSMFMHICGSKHRLAYLKQHYPEVAEVEGIGSELRKKVKQIAETIEKKEGRKQIKVVRGAPIMRRKWQQYPNADDSPSKAKVQHLDVSLSNEEETDCPYNDETMLDSVQDEKDVQKEQEKSQKDKAKPDEKVEPNKAFESSQDIETEDGSKDNNSEKCETSEQLPEENNEAEQEFTANFKEFTSQEELLDYLQSFEILNEDDASFILKVTQTLTDALVEYRHQLASNKDLLDTECNGEAALECSIEQSDLTSADISDSDTAYSSSQSAKQPLAVNEDNESQNVSSGSLGTAHENITTEFLNTVRNMNVEEVTATLHKIAAANPAFRGIDIPKVIRILTESGTLRPSNSSTK
ncbi:uncharacterized protein LOC135178816 [Pogoniulus pusillus]|uniref:uncharacterized protein LOC135178816 n=1 Tax=Pogoniulus pusillus TaxID=488313 RepID=UPI0030B96D69